MKFVGSSYGRLLTDRGVRKLKKQIESAGGYKPIKDHGGLEDWVPFMVRILLQSDHNEETEEERLGMVDGDHRKTLFMQKYNSLDLQ